LQPLQALHDQGVLELLRGVLGGGNKILEIVVDASKTPEAIRGIRNLVIMTKIVGSMDPELLKKLAGAVPDVLVGAAKAQEAAPPGLWETLRMLRNKNLRRGVAVANNVLEALGKNSSAQKGWSSNYQNVRNRSFKENGLPSHHGRSVGKILQMKSFWVSGKLRALQLAHSPVLRCGLAVASFVIALGLALLAQRFGFPNVEIPLFLFSVAITAWYARPGPVALALMLSIGFFDYFFTEPRYTLYVTPSDIPYLIVFISFALLVDWFSAVRRRVEGELRQARDDLQVEVVELKFSGE
jgi:uncharacterized protein YjgD (DUF1641 family)